MSQPRRRRRRGRRGGQQGSGGQSKKEAIRESVEGVPVSEPRGERSGRSRRRRGRGRSGRPASPKSSEDLVRALPKERPATLTADPDGQTLEGVIGDLQSTWGVPQYPQEYRITVKVAEEREARGSESGNGEAAGDKARPASGDQKRERGEGGRSDQPRREKAPAAPGMSAGGAREKSGGRKRRRRRRRGGGGGSGDGPPPGSS